MKNCPDGPDKILEIPGIANSDEIAQKGPDGKMTRSLLARWNVCCTNCPFTYMLYGRMLIFISTLCILRNKNHWLYHCFKTIGNLWQTFVCHGIKIIGLIIDLKPLVKRVKPLYNIEWKSMVELLFSNHWFFGTNLCMLRNENHWFCYWLKTIGLMSKTSV